MRLDKFLKVSRLIKRRTVAKEVADQGRIQMNDVKAKASTEVKPGDVLKIRFGQKLLTVQVKLLKEHPRKEEASELYTVLAEEKIKQETDLNIETFDF